MHYYIYIYYFAPKWHIREPFSTIHPSAIVLKI